MGLLQEGAESLHNPQQASVIDQVKNDPDLLERQDMPRSIAQ